MSAARFLAGRRVLDLSQYVPGPWAALMLADLGADVIKVEPPGGDPMRALPGPRDGDGISPFWKLMNGGKTVVELDLKSTGGADALRGLLGKADVLLESYRPGVLDRFGYGATGPWAQRSGHDLNYMATTGGLAASGIAARPLSAFPPTADYASGLQAALAICAALAGGRGARIDLSLAETVLDPAEVPTHPQVAARGLVREVDGRVEPSFPAWIDGAPPAPRAAARVVSCDEALARWA